MARPRWRRSRAPATARKTAVPSSTSRRGEAASGGASSRSLAPYGRRAAGQVAITSAKAAARQTSRPRTAEARLGRPGRIRVAMPPADQGRRRGQQQPLPQLRAEQQPARRSPAARQLQAGPPTADQQDADHADRSHRQRERPNRSHRQHRGRGRPLVVVALHDVQQPVRSTTPVDSDASLPVVWNSVSSRCRPVVSASSCPASSRAGSTR